MSGITLTQAGGAGVVNGAGAQNPAPVATVITGAPCVLAFTGFVPTAYLWGQAVPLLSAAAALSSTTAANPTFTPDVPGNYDLVFTDPSGIVYTLQLQVQQVLPTQFVGPMLPRVCAPSQVATPAAGEEIFCDNTAGNVTTAKLSDGSLVTFVRQFMPAMKQLVWFIDPVNGSDGNVGSTSGTAIKTDAERQRRMGPVPQWNGGEYHIRYLNDVPATDPVRYVGARYRNSNIFCHGSATDGQGQSTIYSGTITALLALNNSTAGGTNSWQLTDSNIPASWTASSLVGRRIRLTSGASTGAKSFAVKDLGSKVARCSEFMGANTYTFPFQFTNLNVKAPPSNGNTYVVERLTSITSFYWNVQDVNDGGLNTGFKTGCIESLALGVDSAGNEIGDFNVIASSDALCFDGCMVVWFGDGFGGTHFYGGCGIYGSMLPGFWQNVALSGGHYSGASAPNIGLAATNLFIEIQNNFLFQLVGVQFGNFYIQCFCQLYDFGMFDWTSAPRLQGQRVEFRGKYWGTGNSGRMVEFNPNARALFDANAQFNVSVATSPEFGFLFNNAMRTAIPAFDTGSNAYTANRNTTLTNLTASLTTGFANSMTDPVSGGGLVKT